MAGMVDTDTVTMKNHKSLQFRMNNRLIMSEKKGSAHLCLIKANQPEAHA
jgi:hypothetical protein